MCVSVFIGVCIYVRKGRGGGEDEKVRVCASAVVVVCWLLNVPATCKCISGTDQLRQFYVQIKLSILPSDSILTPGRAVPTLTQ